MAYDTTGGGVAIADIDGNGKLDVLFMSVDKTDSGGRNDLFEYAIGWDIRPDGTFEGGITEHDDISAMAYDTTGGGVAIADIDGNGKLDVLFMSVDKTDSGGRNDLFEYAIGWDIRPDGTFEGGITEHDDISAMAYDTTGGGVAFCDIDDIEVKGSVASPCYCNVPICFGAQIVSGIPKGELTWSWDFDASDGLQGDAEGQYPVHTFTRPGTYTVTVTVSDGSEGGSDTLTVVVKELTTNEHEKDTDNDGLWDGDEYFGDLPGLFVGPGDYSGSNYDGIDNSNNYVTNPMNPDTDGDGLYDGWNDANRNGIWDGNEEKGEIGDPNNAGGYGTSPINPDTDGDGMSDLYEVRCGIDVGGWQDPNVYNGRYAVLIAAADPDFDEFWNDLKIMHDILIDVYGYIDDGDPGFDPTTDNIAVLYGNGDDMKKGKYAPHSPITDLAATKDNIQTVFTKLNGVMTNNDFLFVFTFDHGNYEDINENGHADLGESAMLHTQDGDIRDDDFASSYVGLIQHYSRRVFVMQQCFGGGFIDDLSNARTVILTASRGDEIAWRADDNPNQENENVRGTVFNHGEFNYHFMSALRGVTPQGNAVNADGNGNGYVSIAEAFNYVFFWDSINPNGGNYVNQDRDGDGKPDVEHPQLDDDGNGLSQQNGDNNDGAFAGNTYL